jgi:hypothetical protein
MNQQECLNVPTGTPELPDRLELGVTAAATALAAHSEAVGPATSPEGRVWMLLASLHEYCAAFDVDFDEQMRYVRQQIATREIDLPLSRKQHESSAPASTLGM